MGRKDEFSPVSVPVSSILTDMEENVALSEQNLSDRCQPFVDLDDHEGVIHSSYVFHHHIAEEAPLHYTKAYGVLTILLATFVVEVVYVQTQLTVQ